MFYVLIDLEWGKYSEPAEWLPTPLPRPGGLTYAQGPHVRYEKNF